MSVTLCLPLSLMCSPSFLVMCGLPFCQVHHAILSQHWLCLLPGKVFHAFPFVYSYSGLSQCPLSPTKPSQPFQATEFSDLYGMYYSFWDLIIYAHAQVLSSFMYFLSFGHNCAPLMSRDQAILYNSLSIPFNKFSLWPGNKLGVGYREEWA